MSYRIQLVVDEKTEQAVKNLQQIIPPDDAYLYLMFMIKKMNLFADEVYNANPEMYTDICIEEPEHLLFLNFLASYEKIIDPLNELNPSSEDDILFD